MADVRVTDDDDAVRRQRGQRAVREREDYACRLDRGFKLMNGEDDGEEETELDGEDD
jgi:hypothetical protein